MASIARARLCTHTIPPPQQREGYADGISSATSQNVSPHNLLSQRVNEDAPWRATCPRPFPQNLTLLPSMPPHLTLCLPCTTTIESDRNNERRQQSPVTKQERRKREKKTGQARQSGRPISFFFSQVLDRLASRKIHGRTDTSDFLRLRSYGSSCRRLFVWSRQRNAVLCCSGRIA